MNVKKLSLLLTVFVTVNMFGQNDEFLSILQMAKEGNCVCQISVAEDYYNGRRGVQKDYKKSLEWFNKALNNKDFATIKPNFQAEVYTYMGHIYCFGRGVPKNYKEAVKWYKLGSDRDDEYSTTNLAYCYENGYGVKKDMKKANELYLKAANLGYSMAMSSLGYNYFHGIGTEIDYEKAVYWYRKAADLGYMDAQNNLAKCYYDGKGVEKNDGQAKLWWTYAARQGQAKAIDNLDLVKDVKMPANPLPAPELAQTGKSSIDSNIPKNTKENRNLFAVIIGNEKYQNEVDVPFAENDARIFKEYVNKTLGAPEKQIKYISNGTLNGIRMAIRWLSQAMDICEGQGQIIFYYAGHGIPDEADKSAYLLPVDGIGSDPESAYSLDRLYKEFGQMKAKRVSVFLDACFSGAKREGGMMASARGVAIKVKAAPPQGKMIIFTAAQGDETAYPYQKEGHGMFTYFLLKKIRESKGNIRWGELSDYVSSEVKRCSFIENNKMQTPTINASKTFGNNWRNETLN